ncbi:MAG TPA: YihY/virulence factor BrkB family protein [Mollicutes bacterium]|nr:YihY/virulence factor BrkB family protein [Mollicutes bacterium]
MLDNIKKLYTKIKKINKQPIMSILPGQLAFFFTLSLPPLFSLVGIIGNILSVSTEGFIEFINNSFPLSTSNLILPVIRGKGINFGLIAFMIGAFLMISKGTKAIIVTSNVLYDVKETNKVKQRIKALFMVVTLAILLAFMIIVPILGDSIMALLKNIKQINYIFNELMIVYNILKLPISFIFIFFTIKLMYTIAPDKFVKGRDVTYGALFTTVFWVISSRIYTYYITHFAKFDVFYGNIANLIILLLWLYLLSYIFVLGMALNAGTYSLELEIKNSK